MKIPGTCHAWVATRRAVMAAAMLAALPLAAPGAQAQDTVRIGLPTKTYWPTIVAETALRQKLFQKEGINAELTVYRGGAECFEALAAGAADVILNSASFVAAGRKKGVLSKGVAGGALGYYGWYLVVRADSKIASAAELEGKKVGITSAGSGSDILALWTQQDRKLKFTRVPLGGGGLVPNLLSGNVDAVVLYSPLTFQFLNSKEVRSLIDFGAEVPPHLTSAWIASEKIIKEKPQVVQKTVNALYGAVAFLADPKNRAEAVKLIAEIDEISPEIAAMELDGNLKRLSADGDIQRDWMVRAMEMAKLIGMTDLAPVDDTYVTSFKPVPTRP